VATTTCSSPACSHIRQIRLYKPEGEAGKKVQGLGLDVILHCRDLVPPPSEMAVVSFTLSEEAVAALRDALICLNKFSDDVSFEAQKDKVRISASFGISSCRYLLLLL